MAFYEELVKTVIINKKNKKVTVKISGNEKEINCSHILIAAGRKPQTERLNLEAAGAFGDLDGASRKDAPVCGGRRSGRDTCRLPAR